MVSEKFLTLKFCVGTFSNLSISRSHPFVTCNGLLSELKTCQLNVINYFVVFRMTGGPGGNDSVPARSSRIETC